MAQRMSINQFVAELAQALDRRDGYIMGSYGQNPRTGYLDLSVPESKCKSAWKPNGYYYTQYDGKRRTQALKWRETCTRVWDCNGMAEGIYELFSGERIDSKARYNYAQWCDPKGSGLIPVERRVPGAAVFWSDGKASAIHHVAYLWKPVKAGEPEGDWYIIEAKGVMYGVVKSKLKSRKPNFWGWMTKYFDYSGEPVPEPPKLGDRTLKKGCKGPDVVELQDDLLKLGYSLPMYGADSEFGSETEKAVKAFQEARGLKPTGVYDEATRAALTGVDAPQGLRDVIITGNTVNVRSAPKLDARVLGVVKRGDRLPYQEQTREDEGRVWYLVIYRNENAWVSGKYSEVAK